MKIFRRQKVTKVWSTLWNYTTLEHLGPHQLHIEGFRTPSSLPRTWLRFQQLHYLIVSVFILIVFILTCVLSILWGCKSIKLQQINCLHLKHLYGHNFFWQMEDCDCLGIWGMSICMLIMIMMISQVLPHLCQDLALPPFQGGSWQPRWIRDKMLCTGGWSHVYLHLLPPCWDRRPCLGARALL